MINENRILIWDLPTRIFHWLLVICFIGAYLSGEEDEWQRVHEAFGYTLLALIGFRLLWGVIGTRHARFSDFLCSPGRAVTYMRSLLSGKPQHYLGHNPAGSWAIIGLLLLSVMTSLSGIATEYDIGGEEFFEEIHEFFANAMLALVGLHIAGVLFSSWMHRENLVRAMLDGRKRGAANAGISHQHWIIAIMLLAATIAFWISMLWA